MSKKEYKKDFDSLYGRVKIPNGDPYGIRTHVTAVKGRCLNRLTKGPLYGSGGQIRTNDLPGMNRPL